MKERLMVKTLITEFIEKDYGSPIALLVGIRRVGKTTILKQISKKYSNSTYIELKPNSDDMLDLVSLEINNGKTLILIDEITNCIGYDVLSQDLYDIVAATKNVKIIMTGSSPYHLNEVSYRKLGGGRSIVFKLPPITFTEYLYFTDKISCYDDIDNVKNEWFNDYLQNKDLEPSLCICLDNNYLRNWETINSESNENSLNFIKTNLIKNRDIIDIFNLISYNLVTQTDWNLDLSSLLVSKSSSNVSNLNVRSVAKIILFLIDSGLATVVISNRDLDIGNVRKALRNCKNSDDLDDIFYDIIIMMISPLFYIPFGREIFDGYGHSLDVLKSGLLLGLLVEVYLSGALVNNSNDAFCTIRKLLDNNDLHEVDIFSEDNMLMIEASVKDKKKDSINLDKHFEETNCIRICTSKEKNYISPMYYVIPYAKVICLVDTGKIFELNKSSKTNLLIDNY